MTSTDNIENNKALVRRFLGAVEHNGVAKAMEFVADDGSWWVLGRPPLGGTYNKSGITHLLLKALESIEGGWTIDVKAVTAEEDRVAVECENEAKLVNGTTYRGHYHMLFTVRDGKIQQVKEYWGAPLD
jgi:uncharacterized protein